MKLSSIKNIGYSSAAVVLLGLTSCNTVKSTANTTEISDSHTAQNSVDYDGIYLGILPCADCEGIKTTIYLNQDNTYVMKQEYLGKSENIIEEKGDFIWAKNANIISLKPTNANGQKLKLFVGENYLTMLDQSGNKITGSLADHYTFSKDNVMLLNKKWHIMELYGKKFSAESTMKKEGYVQFGDKSLSASAGCNVMNGGYKLLPKNQLEIGNVMSTMMACGDMSAEQSLGKVLAETKSFQVNIDELSLLNKDQKIIAKFKVPMH